MKRTIHSGLKYVLGAGTLAYGALSISRQERFAELTGMEEATVRELAMRDIASGVQILTAANPVPALFSRILYDLSDAFKLARRKPALAPVALLWALLAGVAILTRTGAPEPAAPAPEVAIAQPS